MNFSLCVLRKKPEWWGVVVGGGRKGGFFFKPAIPCRRFFAFLPHPTPGGQKSRCPLQNAIFDRKEVKKLVKSEEIRLQTATLSEANPLQSETKIPHNHTQVRRCLLELWDMVIDLQDQISTILALYEHPDPGIGAGTAWVYRPGMEPEKVDLVPYAKEVLGIE